MIKKICFFAHFDKDSLVDDYVLYYIKSLKEVCDEIIFVSVSNVSEKEQEKLNPYIAKFINKENKGYDFGSWKAGMEFIGFENLQKYDEIIIANDSCYAPIYQLQEMFDKMNSVKCDFWGATKSYFGIQPHIQSYFIVFKKSIIKSEFFINFWKKVTNHEEKYEYVMNYELGLSKQAIKSGFKCKSYINVGIFQCIKDSILRSIINIKRLFDKSQKIQNKIQKMNLKRKINSVISNLGPLGVNYSLFNVFKLVKNKKYPFIKVMLMRDNPYNQNLDKIIKYIEKNTKYPIELIENHIERMK